MPCVLKAARLKWAVRPRFSDANHPPKVSIRSSLDISGRQSSWWLKRFGCICWDRWTTKRRGRGSKAAAEWRLQPDKRSDVAEVWDLVVEA